MAETESSKVSRLFELTDQLLQTELSPVQRNLAISIRETAASLSLPLSDQQPVKEEVAPSVGPSRLDRATLRETSMNDPEFEAELVISFLAETAGMLRKMAGSPPDEIRKLAHSVNGSSSTLGVFALAQLAARLEFVSVEGQASLIEELEREFQAVKVELEQGRLG